MSTAASRSEVISAAADRPSPTRHLYIEDGQVGPVLADQADYLVPTARLGHDLVTLLLEGLFQVEAYQGLILGYDDSGYH